MNRFATRTSQFVIDVVVLSLAFTLAALIRFDWDVPADMLRRLLFVLPYVVLLQYTMLTFFGITRFSWRFISLRDVVRILLAITAAAAVLLAIRLAGEPHAKEFKPLRYALVPIGVLLADSLLAFLAVAGVRALRRLIGERMTSQQYHSGGKAPERTVLVGAGQGGVLVAQEITRRADLAIKAVAFVDDDPVKVGTVIHGIKVLGTTKDLAHICESQRITQALITISGAPGTAIRRITDECKAVGLKVKIVPGTYQIMDGRVNLSRIRDVAIDDLLRRQPVRLDSTEVTAVVRGKRVMITGAGGSIGAELCRQCMLYEPTELVLVERAENNLFEIHRELESRFPKHTIIPCLADITDAMRMEELFSTHRPQTIFHAAAHKHVPMMEWNPGEAVKNNTLGTKAVADLADRFACERFVMISTDKAVRPTSVMGATKRAAELYVQAIASTSQTKFVTVRFGNVLGSAGSVIPIFRAQIENGGPITVTHPDMQRYFMTIPEACQLVMQASALSAGGEIFILDMGEPVRIVDLATDLIRLSGLEPERDIQITFTGVRPGEKLFEELSTEGEHIGRTTHPKIFVGRYQTPLAEQLNAQLTQLQSACASDRADRVRTVLRSIVFDYAPRDSSSSAPPEPEASAPSRQPHAGSELT